MQTTLFLYGTSHCHLCEQAQGILTDVLQSANGFTVHTMDVAEDDCLMDRYGLRIPVLAVDGHRGELDWPFDHTDVLTLIHSIQRENPCCQ